MASLVVVDGGSRHARLRSVRDVRWALARSGLQWGEWGEVDRWGCGRIEFEVRAAPDVVDAIVDVAGARFGGVTVEVREGGHIWGEAPRP